MIHPVNEIWFSGISKSDREVVKSFLLALINQYPFALGKARSLLSSKVQNPDCCHPEAVRRVL
jgi:hypothetical protein